MIDYRNQETPKKKYGLKPQLFKKYPAKSSFLTKHTTNIDRKHIISKCVNLTHLNLNSKVRFTTHNLVNKINRNCIEQSYRQKKQYRILTKKNKNSSRNKKLTQIEIVVVLTILRLLSVSFDKN